jgi:hypothetical protein
MRQQVDAKDCEGLQAYPSGRLFEGKRFPRTRQSVLLCRRCAASNVPCAAVYSLTTLMVGCYSILSICCIYNRVDRATSIPEAFFLRKREVSARVGPYLPLSELWASSRGHGSRRHVAVKMPQDLRTASSLARLLIYDTLCQSSARICGT